MLRNRGVYGPDNDDVMQEVLTACWLFNEKNQCEQTPGPVVSTITKRCFGSWLRIMYGTTMPQGGVRTLREGNLSMDALVKPLAVVDDYAEIEGPLLDVEALIESHGCRTKGVLRSYFIEGLSGSEAGRRHGVQPQAACSSIVRFAERVAPIVKEMVAA